jgi:LmbE family N-acetylglucosaminyl deacetylase
MNLPDKSTILIIAPHPDDEILGLGGATKKFSDQGHDVAVLLVSGHLPPLYKEEVFLEHKEQALEAHKIVGVTESIFLEIPATFVKDETVASLNGKIYSVLKEVSPNVVFMPFPDRHIDHQVIFESSMVAIRPVYDGKKIDVAASYEVLSETHWNAPAIEPAFNPNITIDITDQIEKKLEALSCFKGEIMPFPGPRSLEAVEALAKFRGTQAGFAYGESLQLLRMKL